MNPWSLTIVAAATSFAFNSAITHAQALALPKASAPPYVVENSSVHQVHSNIVDEFYELRVVLPTNYQDGSNETHPVVYALDGQWNSTIVKDISGKLSHDGLLPDPIVVAITWAGVGDAPDLERWRDFSPTEVPDSEGSGEAAKFLQALDEEIFPFIESTYRANRQRAITGASLGGLFVTYAMLERPDLFEGYVAVSAPYNLAQDYFDNRLEELSRDFLREERMYFAVGSQYDNTEAVQQFVGNLRSVVPKNCRLALDVFQGVGHAGVEPLAYTRGLLHAFERPRLRLKKHLLERYEGTYGNAALEGFPTFTLEIGRHGSLYLSQEGQEVGDRLYAESPTQFYLDGVNVDLSFHENEEGVMSFTFNIQRTFYELSRQSLDAGQVTGAEE